MLTSGTAGVRVPSAVYPRCDRINRYDAGAVPGRQPGGVTDDKPSGEPNALRLPTHPSPPPQVLPERLSTSQRWSSASLVARDALYPDPVPLTQLRNRAICRYTARNIQR